jgi:RES domain
MPDIAVAYPPEGGLWRVARGEPFALRDPDPPLRDPIMADPNVGNRFDSALGDFRVWYFATKREGCYGETLAVLRPDPKVVAATKGEDDEGLMPLGQIPADWRRQRTAVRVKFPDERPFLDVEAASTRSLLRVELAWLLPALGLGDIDVAAIRSKDRRLTRWISQWAWHKHLEPQQMKFAGVRFVSRLDDDWECWAVFDDVTLEEQERRAILVTDDELRKVAEGWSLDIF